GGRGGVRPGGARGCHGRRVRPFDAVGEGAGVSVVSVGHGASLRVRELPSGSAVDAARLVSVRAWRVGLQLPGPESVQREVRSGLAAPLPRLSGWSSTGARAG